MKRIKKEALAEVERQRRSRVTFLNPAGAGFERCPHPQAARRVVYALVCPIYGYVRYVGVTSNIERRVVQHNSHGNKRLQRWYKELKVLYGVEPKCVVIDTVPGVRTENGWIKFYKRLGFDLFNMQPGIGRVHADDDLPEAVQLELFAA